MAKDKLTDYDGVTASNNTDIGGVSIAEGMLPSNVNNSMRELTKQLGAFADGTDGVDVLKLQDDTDTNSIKLQAPASVTADTTFTMPDGDGSADQVLKTDGSGQLGWADRHANPSLIINGAMQISQRGTSFTPNTGLNYSLDRFATLETTDGDMTISQDSSVVPTGFQYSLKAVTGTADASLAAGQRMILLTRIEGYDVAHLELGTANAKQFTLSFYVRSSLTGTFGGAFQNSASDRNYPFTYTINSADTWEQKTITITGDTSGTWNTTNGTGLQVCWGLGVGSTYSGTAGAWAAGDINSATGGTSVIGTASATWYLTGVKLEVGSTATDFIHEDYGTTLRKCQRYYSNVASFSRDNFGQLYSSTQGKVGLKFPVIMRTAATVTANSPFTSMLEENGVAVRTPSTAAVNYNSKSGCIMSFNVTGTAGNGLFVRQCPSDTTIEADAEL